MLFIIKLFTVFIILVPNIYSQGDIIVAPDGYDSTNKIVESFDMKSVDVLTLTKQISKLTGKKFILSDSIAGKKGITIVSPSPITVQDAYDAFLTVLDSNDLAVVSSGQFLKIVDKKNLSGGVGLHKGEYYPKNDQYITRVIKIRNINASDLEELTTGRTGAFLGGGLKVKALTETNTLLVTGTGSQISELEEIIKLVDVKGYNYQLAVIPVINADAVSLTKIIENLVIDTSSTTQTTQVGRRPIVPTSFSTGSRGSGGAERYSKIFSDERTNSIVVLANNAGIEKIKELVKKLDFEVTGGSNIHVYFLKNAKAKEISTTLGNILGSAAKAKTPGAASGSSLFEGVQVTEDEGSNALVVSARPKDYEALKKIIDQLDQRKGQVLFETITVELTMDEDSSFGISSNYAMSSEVPRAVGFDPGISSSNNIMNFLSDPTALSGMILGFGSKETVSVNFGGETLKIPRLSSFITALEKNSRANVLQRPSIITVDNEEAEIKVMDKIPVVRGTIVSQITSQQNIEDVEVGLLLKITPRINIESDFIKLDIEQETSNLTDKAPRDLSGTTVSTNTRKIKTSVVVKDGDTVVIGGLYKDDVSTTHNKVPLLGDIPIIGWLFKGKTTRSTKTNLLVFITPNIVRNYEAHRDLTVKAIEGRRGFVKTNLNDEDKFKPFMDSIEAKNKKEMEVKEEDYLPDSGVKIIPLQ